jgi:hypothetical protein
LDYPYVTGSLAEERPKRYNPFNLRLPYELTSYEHLFQHTHEKSYWVPGAVTKETAAQKFFDLLKLFNLMYLSFLRAINNNEKSLKKLKAFVFPNAVFTKLEFLPRYVDTLSKRVQDPRFLLALLAYLMLNIVYSEDRSLSTKARIGALEIINTEFDAEHVAAAFKKFSLGYDCFFSEEKLYDLIPKKFVVSKEEFSGLPHNRIFMKNEKIVAIFSIRDNKCDLGAGVAYMLTRHPQELAQVLHSFLRIAQFYVDSKAVFLTIVSLSQLDNRQKRVIFGNSASFRNENSLYRQGVSPRIRWSLGLEDFGDDITLNAELPCLSKESLIKHIKQYSHSNRKLEDDLKAARLEVTQMKNSVGQTAYRIQHLETVLKEAKKNLDNNHQQDPKGYFSILALSPNISGKQFDTLLKENYRFFKLRYHPDKGGDPELFKKLTKAYECLNNPSARAQYCQVTSHAFSC